MGEEEKESERSEFGSHFSVRERNRGDVFQTKGSEREREREREDTASERL